MSIINKTAVLNPFSDLTANILDYVPRATTSEFGIVAIGSGINVDALGRIYLDTQEYSDRLTTIEAQAASSLDTQKSEVAAAIAQVNLTQSQAITALTLEVSNLKTDLTNSITATQTDLINRADQLAQNVTDITQQLTQDKAAFTQEIQDALDSLKDDAFVASSLRTPRKIQGVDFDGTQDISLPTFSTQTDGLVPKRGGSTTTKYLREDGTWVVPPDTAYALLTKASAEDGTATTANTISAQVLKEAIQYHAPTVTNIVGNAETATKLQTPRTINGVLFDGTQNISLPEAVAYSLPTASDSVLGGIKVGSGLVISNSVLSVGTLNQSTTGNAATANKLQTARTISLTGNVTGSVSFDGSANASITTAITGLGAANGIATLDSNGRVPSTQLPSYVDDVLEYAFAAAFPVTGQSGKIYVETEGNTTYRWSGSGYTKITSGEVSSVAGRTGIVTLTKSDVGLTNVDNTTDSAKNVASAAKLTTARTIGGVSFNGTANINLPGVNTAGNQSTSGNAATTTKLQTPRSIAISGAVTGTATSFDGSSDIAIATTAIDGSNISTGTIPAARIPILNQSTTGNAGSATKLQTARLINGIAFDGTGDINLDVYRKTESNFLALPLGTPIWHNGTRLTIDDGYASYDGQLLNRADFPSLWAKVQSKFVVITDADWLADPKKRAAYSSGNGTTTFRMPDLNGFLADSIKGLHLRGDGNGTIAGETVLQSTILKDAIRNITGSSRGAGTAYGFVYDKNAGIITPRSGAFAIGKESKGLASFSGASTSDGASFDFDASLVVPTANENRPVSAIGIWICRVSAGTAEQVSPNTAPSLTGGNTWAGSQKVTGNLEVTGTFDADIKPLLNASGSLPIYALRSWGIVEGTATPARLVKGGNIASVVDEGVGQYKITFATPMPDLNYGVLFGSTTYTLNDAGTYGTMKIGTKTVNGFIISCGQQSYVDVPAVSFGVIY